MNSAAVKQDRLVTLWREKAVCSSLDVAEHFHKRHGDIIRAIETKIFPNVPKDFNRLNFQGVKYKDAKGEERPMYRMTRDGFTLLVMGFTGKEAMEWKVKYISAFNCMEQLLLERQTPEFLAAREEGRRIRRMETDAIKEFVAYAKAQGSSRAEWYYRSFATLANNAAGVAARAEAGGMEELQIQLVENIIAKKIRQGMAASKGYKDIFRECKEAVAFVLG